MGSGSAWVPLGGELGPRTTTVVRLQRQCSTYCVGGSSSQVIRVARVRCTASLADGKRRERGS